MKRLITLVIAGLLLFNSVAVFADEAVITNQKAEIVVEDGFYEEYIEPVPMYEFESDTVTVDGEEYNARQLKHGYDYGDGDVFFEVYIEIAPLARELGYTVSYVEETDSVVFEKDGVKTQINITETEYMQGEDAMYIDVISYEDRTYVAYVNVEYIIENLCPYYPYTYGYDENKSYGFYTAEAMSYEYKDSFKGFEKINEMFLSGTYTSDSSSEVSAEFSIKDFGISANAGLTVDATTLYENGKFRTDISVDSNGLMNLLDMAMQNEGNGEAEFDFDEKLDFSILYDGEYVYTKGTLNSLLVESEKPYFADEDYKFSPTLEKLINDALNGWIKMDEDMEFDYPQSMEAFVEMIAENDTMSYEDKKNILDVLSAVSTYISMASKEEDKGISYKLELNKDMMNGMLAISGNEIPEELKGIDVEKFDFLVEEAYGKDLSGTSKVSGELILNKLFLITEKTRVGELNLTIESEGITKASSEKVSAPEIFVSSKILTESFYKLYDEYYEYYEG